MAAAFNMETRQVHSYGYILDMTLDPLMNNLVEWNPETADLNDIRGDLAEKWELGTDGTTWTFHLRENAEWHDGVPVTAGDVVFSLNSMIDHETVLDKQGNAIFAGRGLSGNVRKTRTYAEWPECCREIDDKTVEIQTKFFSATFIPTLALATNNIMAKHSVLDEGKIQTMAEWEDLNGSGPFKLTSFDQDVSAEFVKNEDYFKEGYPRIDGMRHFPILDAGTLVAAFKTGQVLMSNGMVTKMNVAEARKLGEDMEGELTVHWGGPSLMYGVIINTKKAPFDDVRVRRAVGLAIHRQPVIEIVGSGIHPLGTPLPPGMWYSYTNEEAAQIPGFRESAPGVKHPDDIAEAKALLKEAGVPEGIEVTLSARTSASTTQQAEIVADQLRRFLGWDVKLRIMESAAGLEAYDAGDFQFAVQATALALTDPDEALKRYMPGAVATYAAGGKGPGGEERYYVVEGLQELYDTQARERNEEKRRALVQEANDILLNVDNVYPGILWEMRHWPVHDSIQGFNVHATIYAHLKQETIWCDPACR